MSRAEGSTSTSGYTVYYVEIHTKLASWAVAYRYSQMEKLHSRLKKLDKDKTMPQFPEKKMFKNNQKVVEERKTNLQIYFNELVSSMDIFES